MANPQCEEGYTKIANELIDALYKVNLSPYEIRVLLFIIRKTYGFNRKTGNIPLSVFSKEIAVDKRSIHRTLKSLQSKNMILVTKGSESNKSNAYGIQKNHDQWQLDMKYRSKHSLQRKMTDSGQTDVRMERKSGDPVANSDGVYGDNKDGVHMSNEDGGHMDDKNDGHGDNKDGGRMDDESVAAWTTDDKNDVVHMDTREGGHTDDGSVATWTINRWPQGHPINKERNILKTDIKKARVSPSFKNDFAFPIETKNEEQVQHPASQETVNEHPNGHEAKKPGSDKKKSSVKKPSDQEKQEALLKFNAFWRIYPKRNGMKVGKQEALQKFLKLSPYDQLLLLGATKKYTLTRDAREGIGIKDPHRFIADGKGIERWRDFIEADAAALAAAARHSRPPGSGGGSRPYPDAFRRRFFGLNKKNYREGLEGYEDKVL